MAFVPVGGVFQHRKRRLDLAKRHHGHAFGWRRVQGHSCGSVAVVEQDLGEGTACGVTDEDRR